MIFKSKMHFEITGSVKHAFLYLAGRTIRVDGARVIKKDVSATNGVIHVIDHVLVPSSLKTTIANL